MEHQISCIIIEDEKPAQEVLKKFLSQFETTYKLLACFENAVQALAFLKFQDIDLIFLDIQIPALNGIDFLRGLKHSPQVIITSAYSRYALEAFDLDVRDYLMKPFSFERFVKALNRVSPRPENLPLSEPSSTPNDAKQNGFAFFNVNKTRVKVQFNEVLYLESMREYVYIHTEFANVITKMTLAEMEKIFRAGFIRCHRSFMVKIDKVTAYSAEEILIGDKSIPIGSTYKKLVGATFAKHTIQS